jgi:hypothetical protein
MQQMMSRNDSQKLDCGTHAGSHVPVSDRTNMSISSLRTGVRREEAEKEMEEDNRKRTGQ